MSNKRVLAAIALVLFGAASVVKLYSSLAQRIDLNYVSTAALMPFLVLFYILRARKVSWLVVLALLFSLLGDLFMLASANSSSLILGMGAFLLSHVFFIAALIRPVAHFRTVKLWHYSLVVAFVLYGVVMFLLLRPSLGDFKVPAVIYLVAVLLRGYAAVTRFGEFRGLSYWGPLIGSVIFIFSDTIIAFNVFTFGGHMQYGDFSAALTYIPAQLLLVLGFLKN